MSDPTKVENKGSNDKGSNDKSSNDKAKKKKEKGNKKRQEQSGRGGMIVTEPVAGTRDFLPPEMRQKNWLFSKFHEAAKIFGFEEYDAPILEPEELYRRKAKDKAEEILQQMYNFKDKSDLPVSLRPEMTPSLARLILKQGKFLMLPLKWYSIPQCWRFETTTRGRKREHYQWNMDIWGIEGVAAETELIAAIVHFFKSVGLTSKDVCIKVSSRKLLQSILEKLDIKDEKFTPACTIIDKLDKLEKVVILEELEKIGVPKDVSEKLLIQIEAKTVDELVAILGDENEGIKELKELFNLAKGYGFHDWIRFDPKIVRGLSYYTGIVFEAFAEVLGRAICGGGRYDKILTTYDAPKDIPACGFGFGDCVIMEVLEEKKLLPELKHKIDDVVIPFNEDLRSSACQIASILRGSGKKVDIILKKSKVKQAYNYADRVGADRAVLIAPDEWEKNLVRIKYLRDGGAEYDVPIENLLTWKRPEESNANPSTTTTNTSSTNE